MTDLNDADSGMSGDAVAEAELVWANLPTSNRPWASLQTSEKALVCHVLARYRISVLEEAAKEIEARAWPCNHGEKVFVREYAKNLATAIRSLSQPVEGSAGASCVLCAGKCRGHTFGDPVSWEPEPGSVMFSGASVGPGYSAEPEPEVSALSGEYPSRDCVSDPMAKIEYRKRWLAVRDAILWNLKEPVLRNLNAMHVLSVALQWPASAIEARSGETADAGSTEGESATGNAGDAQTPAASNKGGRDGE